jgi:hypothetical protein
MIAAKRQSFPAKPEAARAGAHTISRISTFKKSKDKVK